MGQLVRLEREQGSPFGRVVTRDEKGKEEAGELLPWARVLERARELAGAGSQVQVHVSGQSNPWYGNGYGPLTRYPVQFAPPPMREAGS